VATRKVTDPESRRPPVAAGRPDDRVSNKVDELAKRHYRRVAERLGELLQTGEYDLLIIGGHGYEVPDFVQQLPRPVRDRVAGTFSTEPGLARLTEIRDRAGEIAARYERERDQDLVSSVLEKVAMGGLATLGLGSCLWAGTVGAIQTLLVQEGAASAGVVCDQSGWLALSGEVCPLCGNPTRRTPDVIDELAEVVINEGGTIRHVNSGSARLLAHDTGADLRFPLPERPADA
jgi:peptide chain release factor subunit 1